MEVKSYDSVPERNLVGPKITSVVDPPLNYTPINKQRKRNLGYAVLGITSNSDTECI